MVWFGSLWSSALRAFFVWKSGTSDLCYFEVNLLLGLVVRKVFDWLSECIALQMFLDMKSVENH